jgi:glycerol uptake facilitator-like aquaporin
MSDTGPLARRLAAEALGSALLTATVVGSGIMATRLAGGDEALALLCNAVATVAILVVIVTVFAPLSGAHFNPAVSVVFAVRGALTRGDLAAYVVAQCLGAIAGVVVAHLMFDLAPLTLGAHRRTGMSQWLSEIVATFSLVLAILGGLRHAPGALPWLVGLVIGAAYWFTASTSFANPAVTLARGLTVTFSGIAIGDVPGFVVAEIVGALLAAAAGGWLFADRRRTPAKPASTPT